MAPGAPRRRGRRSVQRGTPAFPGFSPGQREWETKGGQARQTPLEPGPRRRSQEGPTRQRVVFAQGKVKPCFVLFFFFPSEGKSLRPFPEISRGINEVRPYPDLHCCPPPHPHSGAGWGLGGGRLYGSLKHEVMGGEGCCQKRPRFVCILRGNGSSSAVISSPA